MKKILTLIICILSLSLISCFETSNQAFVFIEESNKCSEEVEILYYDKEQTKVIYQIVFDYQPEECLKSVFEQFIKDNKIDELPASDIFYFDKINYIKLIFALKDDTEEINTYLNSLKDQNENIKEIIKDKGYKWDLVYMHDPESYQLDESTKIYDEVVLNSILPYGIYTSVKDINKGLNNYYKKYNKTYEDFTKEELDYINQYNEEYFEDNILIISKMAVLSSSESYLELVETHFKEGTFYLFPKCFVLGTAISTSSSFSWGISLSRNLLDEYKIEDLEIKILYQHNVYPL